MLIRNTFLNNWNLLAGFTVSLISYVSSFFYIPDYVEVATEITSLGQFVSIVITGLTLVLMVTWKDKSHSAMWFVTAILSLSIALIGYFLQQNKIDEFTCFCERTNAKTIVGSPKTVESHVKRGIESHIADTYSINYGKPIEKNELKKRLSQKLSNCTELLGWDCNAKEIWTKKSIQDRISSLSKIYILILPFFILTMLAMLQASKPYIDEFFTTNSDNRGDTNND